LEVQIKIEFYNNIHIFLYKMNYSVEEFNNMLYKCEYLNSLSEDDYEIILSYNTLQEKLNVYNEYNKYFPVWDFKNQKYYFKYLLDLALERYKNDILKYKRNVDFVIQNYNNPDIEFIKQYSEYLNETWIKNKMFNLYIKLEFLEKFIEKMFY